MTHFDSSSLAGSSTSASSPGDCASLRAPAEAAAADGDWRIDAAQVLARSGCGLPASVLDIVDETGSTNTDLMRRMRDLAREPAKPGVQAVRVAYRQTAGRGRRGRSWYAEPGRALTFSLACVLPRPLGELAGLSLAVGVALVEALRAMSGIEPHDATRIGLKWPNDVLLDDGKLAGILVETAWSTPCATAAVIGIGLNVREDEALAAEVAAAAQAGEGATSAHLRATPPVALTRVVAQATLTDTLALALSALTRMIEDFSAAGFAPFRPRWNACHLYAGREVVLLERGAELARGAALGVDQSGQLLLATADGVKPIATGDVSLRLAQS
jgi:BirA family biotin operon repressor/biotin-[acetyl-CoA-carboxylase] ligase